MFPYVIVTHNMDKVDFVLEICLAMNTKSLNLMNPITLGIRLEIYN